MIEYFYSGLGYLIKTNCPLVGLGPAGGVPSVGDASPYLREFWRKTQKTPNG